jgi:hypothetical protein
MYSVDAERLGLFRYTDANVETMFAEPATDEQLGAMPEIVPSPAIGADTDPR